jgi:hypothetical protein
MCDPQGAYADYLAQHYGSAYAKEIQVSTRTEKVEQEEAPCSYVPPLVYIYYVRRSNG